MDGWHAEESDVYRYLYIHGMCCSAGNETKYNKSVLKYVNTAEDKGETGEVVIFLIRACHVARAQCSERNRFDGPLHFAPISFVERKPN